MKKNKMMRAASALLVAVLLTTSVISGTFAKYVTEGTGSDSARVAKFGVAVIATGGQFKKQYEDHSSSGFEFTVEAEEKVVAPGTSGNLVNVALTGTPEVAVEVTYVADLALSDNWTVDGKWYCPLKFTVEGTEVNGAAYDNKADLEKAVEDLINGWKKSYEPGTDLSSVEVTNDLVSVSWEWPFYVDDASDVKDTWLGNQAAAGNPATVNLTVKTTVTQLD